MTKEPQKQPFDYESFKQEAFEKLKQGQPLGGVDGILTPLIKDILQESLTGELESHLADEDQTRNRKNGYTSKTVKTKHGAFKIKNPRDRDGTFTPKILPKRKTILNEALDDKIVSLVAIGMSYSDISMHMEEMYGVELSTATISTITDKVIPIIREWQGRQLETVYPFVWMDAFVIKVKEEGFIRKKSAYCVLGVNCEGHKDILGIYLGEAEGAKFWLQVLTDLKNRGVKDIIIASVDGLKGFPEAIESVFSDTEVQLCVIHQIRNSLKYVAWKDYKAFMRDLKLVYKAANKELAEKRLNDLDQKWGNKYPIVMKSWRNNWEDLTNYFKYPEEIRHIIYTTNTIEGFHRQMRKVLKTKGAFTNKDAFMKIAYLALQNISKKWNRPVHNWNRILSSMCILYGERIPLSLRL